MSSTSRVRQASSTSSADTGKSKRARTKHACDECRRSQKKCDGDKPLCRRCYLNGTQCTYTPHKSRSQCACTGQGDEVHRDALVPDVFIFPDTSLSSFHTWSTTSSPNQSPSTSGSGLDTPSPTYLTHEESLGAAQSTDYLSGATVNQAQLENLPPPLQRGSHLYNQRSRSVPNVSRIDSVPPPYRTTSFSSVLAPSSPPHYPFDQVTTMLGPSSAPSAYACQQPSQHLDTSSQTTHNALLLSHYMQLDVGPASMYDFGTQYNQHVRGVDPEIGRHQPSFFSDGTPSFSPAARQSYDGQHQFDQHSQDGYDVSTTTPPMDLDFHANPTSNFSAIQRAVDSEAIGAAAIPQVQTSRAGVNVSSQQLHIEQQFAQFEHTAHGHQDEHIEYPYTQLRATDLGPAAAGESGAQSSMHLHLPPSHFQQAQWGNAELVATSPASGSPSSAYPSPTAFGSFEFYDWAQ
ncbi:hypothetical protein M0805_004480 [Coniferiporia weirii]|nr:hypothetical protein M0805_004480 [Coniferiporia weirii]